MSRPILPWRSPMVALPNDQAAIWIRRIPWYDRPVRGTYLGDNWQVQIEPPTNFNAGAIPYVLSMSTVHTWKHQYLADELALFPPP